MHKIIVVFLLFCGANFLTNGARAATYDISFQGTWNENDVSTGSHPASAHFSDIVGVSHVQGAEFWSNGAAASPGVEDVAELGLTAVLSAEISGLQATGSAGDFFNLGSQFNLPKTSGARIQVDDDKPFLSLITMIAPSPDWFVGVSALPLQQNGQWLQSITVELRPYDAGTEDGNTFSLSNPATSNGLISRLNGGADSPFLGRPVIATLELRLIEPIPPVEPPVEPPISAGNPSAIYPVISSLLDE